MKSILDPTFRYTSSANTDIRKTFARIKREQVRQQAQQQAQEVWSAHAANQHALDVQLAKHKRRAKSVL